MLPQEIVSQLAAASDTARFNQSKAFPRFAETGIIVFHTFERARQRTWRAFRAQAQVNSK